MYRLIIAGSRSLGYDDVVAALSAARVDAAKVSAVVSGGARGVDLAGERWARENGIEVVRIAADWSKGRQAGMLRNIELAAAGDGLVAVWDGVSAGTRNMIEVARKRGLRVFVYNVGENSQPSLF